jgi:hypothetical protein
LYGRFVDNTVLGERRTPGYRGEAGGNAPDDPPCKKNSATIASLTLRKTSQPGEGGSRAVASKLTVKTQKPTEKKNCDGDQHMLEVLMVFLVSSVTKRCSVLGLSQLLKDTSHVPAIERRQNEM